VVCDKICRECRQSLSPGSSVLDAGAGECVYKRFLFIASTKPSISGRGNELELWKLDYVGVLHNMPIESNSFDAVLCTQVLEHLEWPRESVKEMYRVLKPSGRLFLTAPMSHMEHQVPYDFFRYTSFDCGPSANMPVSKSWKFGHSAGDGRVGPMRCRDVCRRFRQVAS
jgi:SAM-dependent methyltransferase